MRYGQNCSGSRSLSLLLCSIGVWLLKDKHRVASMVWIMSLEGQRVSCDEHIVFFCPLKVGDDLKPLVYRGGLAEDRRLLSEKASDLVNNLCNSRPHNQDKDLSMVVLLQHHKHPQRGSGALDHQRRLVLARPFPYRRACQYQAGW